MHYLGADDEDEQWETEKLLRFRWIQKGKRRTREFLVLYKNKPMIEATWIPESDFLDKKELAADIRRDRPEEVKV